MVRTVMLLLCFMQAGILLAQEEPGAQYSFLPVFDDLHTSRVKGIAQDSRGFIWLATEMGLYRYDGLHGKVFKFGADADVQLGFSRINRMHQVLGQYLVLEGDKAVNVLDMITARVLYQSPDDEALVETMLYGDYCYLLVEDPDQHTVLYRLHPDGQVDRMQHNFPADLHFLAACTEAHGRVYGFDDNRNLWLLDPATGQLSCIDSTTFHDNDNFVIPVMYCDAANRLWILDNSWDPENSAVHYSPDGKPERVRMASMIPLKRRSDQDPEMIWCQGKDNTLFRFHFRTGQAEKVLTIPNLQSEAYSILEDTQGNLWICATFGGGNGVLVAHPHQQAFHKLLYQPGLEYSRGIACRGIAELNNGKILIAAMEGLYGYDPVTDKVTATDLQFPTGLPIPNIWSVCPSPDNTAIWLSNEGNFVIEYRPGQPLTTIYPEAGPGPNVIMGMVQDAAGVLWMGGENSALWFHTQNRTFVQPSEPAHALFGTPCYQWVQTDPNTFWLCSARGLFRFDSLKQIVAKYDIASTPALPVQSVYDVVQDRDVYWIGTEDGLYALEGDQIRHFSTRDGLPHNAIANLAMDRQGNLWVATYWGLSRRDRITGEFLNYFAEDGLPNNEFNRVGKLQSTDGHLYLSSQNGVLWFDPDSVAPSAQDIPLVLTDFTTFGADGKLQHATDEELSVLKHVVIPAGNKYFQFEFALLTYIKPEENRYTYYLEGIDETWRPAMTLPTVQFNNLPPGNYVLHVRGLSPSGQWSRNDLDIDVLVRQHFYQNIWFRAGISGCIVLLIFLFYQYRVTQRLRIEKMRNRISSDLHDEVGGVLSGVAMQMEVLQGRAPEHLKPFMQRLAESSRNAASKMRDVIWSIDSSKEHFQDLLDRMKAYAVELLGPAEIIYKFETRGVQPSQRLSLDHRQHIFLIYKEALHNILKHSHATEVTVSLVVVKNALTMTIRDNGVGLETITGSSGHGLKNMQDRARRIGAEFTIETSDTGGTQLRLVVQRIY